MSDPKDRHSRRGWWRISRPFADDFESALQLIQRQDVTIRAIEYDWASDSQKFYGISGAFDVVQQGSVVPQYRPHIDLIENTVTWERVTEEMDRYAMPAVRYKIKDDVRYNA